MRLGVVTLQLVESVSSLKILGGYPKFSKKWDFIPEVSCFV